MPNRHELRGFQSSQSSVGRARANSLLRLKGRTLVVNSLLFKVFPSWAHGNRDMSDIRLLRIEMSRVRAAGREVSQATVIGSVTCVR